MSHKENVLLSGLLLRVMQLALKN